MQAIQSPKSAISLGWQEITQRKPEFQRILSLLVQFDERVGRVGHYSPISAHYLRKAVAEHNPVDGLRIFIRSLGGNVFLVTLFLTIDCGLALTTYIHEDGIISERDDQSENPAHPVHSIVCLSDLAKDAVSLVESDLLSLPQVVIDALAEDPSGMEAAS